MEGQYRIDSGGIGVCLWIEFTSYGSGNGLVMGLSIHKKWGISWLSERLFLNEDSNRWSWFVNIIQSGNSELLAHKFMKMKT
jgi:hypothetical protein